jgi:hypothetical protein
MSLVGQYENTLFDLDYLLLFCMWENISWISPKKTEKEKRKIKL